MKWSLPFTAVSFLAGDGLGSCLLQQCVVRGWTTGIHLLCMPVCSHKPYTLSCLETSLRGFGNREGIISRKKEKVGVGGRNVSAVVCFIRGFCLVSITTIQMLSKDVEKYVSVNLSGSLPVWLGAEFHRDSAVVFWSDVKGVNKAHQHGNSMQAETLRHLFCSFGRLLMLERRCNPLLI